MGHIAYQINEPNVVAEEFDGEVVVLNLATGTYYSFENSGHALWLAVCAGTPPGAVVEALKSSGSEHAGAVQDFFDKLVAFDLVRPDPDARNGSDHAAAAAAVTTAPGIEVYEDLADLITADPIHDADDQTGWPATKPRSG